MTGKQILDAYRAVMELSGIVLPYKAARGVAALKKRLAEECRIVVEQEQAIAEQYGGKPKGNGSYKFASPEQAEACAAEMEAFRAQDDDINLPTVDLYEYTDGIHISPASIEALEGIVSFEKEGQDG